MTNGLVFLPLALVALSLVEIAKAGRWQTLFGSGSPGYGWFLRAHVATATTNMLSPFRGGEVIGVGVLALRGSGVAPSVVALAAAKALDALALLLIGGTLVGLPLLGSASPVLAGVALVIALGFAITRTDALRGWSKRHLFSRKLRLDCLEDTLSQLACPRVLAIVTLMCIVVWVCGGLANAAVLLAVGVPPSLDLVARILVSGYVVSLLPAPPASLGVYEAGVTAALVAGGVPLENAIAAAVILHVLLLANFGLLTAATFVGRRWFASA